MSKIIVTSSKKLSSQTVAKITSVISAKKKDCEIVFEIDNSLLGGIKIKENDIIFDASVANELKNIKNYLSR